MRCLLRSYVAHLDFQNIVKFVDKYLQVEHNIASLNTMYPGPHKLYAIRLYWQVDPHQFALYPHPALLYNGRLN